MSFALRKTIPASDIDTFMSLHDLVIIILTFTEANDQVLEIFSTKN